VASPKVASPDAGTSGRHAGAVGIFAQSTAVVPPLGLSHATARRRSGPTQHETSERIEDLSTFPDGPGDVERAL